MKLYKIFELHGGPKSHVTLINSFILAKDDEEVFNYISKTMNYWEEEDFEEGDQTYEEFKKEILENKGDLEDEGGWEDSYYGVHKYGWEELMDINANEIEVLKKFKILEKDQIEIHEVKNNGR